MDFIFISCITHRSRNIGIVHCIYCRGTNIREREKKKKNSETELTANVLKKDPKHTRAEKRSQTQEVKENAF